MYDFEHLFWINMRFFGIDITRKLKKIENFIKVY